MNFTATASGGGDLTYKRQRDGADLDSLPERVSGETTGVLQIDNVKKSHQGETCIVSNAAGPTPSKCARLTVRKCLYLVQGYVHFEDRFCASKKDGGCGQS